jgi:hypothetical protein
MSRRLEPLLTPRLGGGVKSGIPGTMSETNVTRLAQPRCPECKLVEKLEITLKVISDF